MSLFDPVLSVPRDDRCRSCLSSPSWFSVPRDGALPRRTTVRASKSMPFRSASVPELFARVDRWGTRWRIAAIPLGGYVKFHGDMNAASAQAVGRLASMAPEERAVTFGAQPVAERAAIVRRGDRSRTFILAVVIFTGNLLHRGPEHSAAPGRDRAVRQCRCTGGVRAR